MRIAPRFDPAGLGQRAGPRRPGHGQLRHYLRPDEGHDHLRGVNIYPEEIEAVIGRAPEVDDVAVVGVPDEEWGERLHAYVVLRAGCRLEERQILDQCRRELSGYKVPRSLEFIDELPRNTSGKVLKRQLRERGSAGSADA